LKKPASIIIASILIIGSITLFNATIANSMSSPLYGIGGNTLVTIDKTNGVQTTIGSGINTIDGIAFDGGTLYGIDGNTLVTIDKTNGVQTTIGSGINTIDGISFDNGGTLYGIDGNTLVTIDKTNGVQTTIGSGINTIDDIAFDLSVSMAVGGELIPIDTTSLLLAGTYSNAAWLIPVIVSAIGIGFVLVRTFRNSFE